MKSLKHYRFEIRRFARVAVESMILAGLFASRIFTLRFRKCAQPDEVDRACREAAIDEALKESFPASDPPSPSLGHDPA